MDGSEQESGNEDSHTRSFRRRSGKSTKRKSKATGRALKGKDGWLQFDQHIEKLLKDFGKDMNSSAWQE